MEKSEERFLGFCGDIHGELKKLVWLLTEKYKLYNGSIIVAGDFGVGFGRPGSLDVMYQGVSEKLEKHDITIYVVRGNHDNPEYFDGQHDRSRLKFLEDHKVYTIEGKEIYPIGGAVSIDRNDRIQANEECEKYGSRKRCWWPGEKPTYKTENLPDRVDYIVSHEAPLSFDPVIVRKTEDLSIWEDIVESRKYLNFVLGEINCSRWFHGHYHFSTSGAYGDILYRGLDIEEIIIL